MKFASAGEPGSAHTETPTAGVVQCCSKFRRPPSGLSNLKDNITWSLLYLGLQLTRKFFEQCSDAQLSGQLNCAHVGCFTSAGFYTNFFLALISRFLQTQGAAAVGTSAGPQCVTEVNKVFPHTAHNPNDLVQEVAVITEQST